MSDSEAQFSVGQVIHHRLFDYRGIVYDVDPSFQGTEEWYEEVAQSKPPRDRPWYHVLVDGASHSTYVAERNLEPDDEGSDVQHPLIEELFKRLSEGLYEPKSGIN